MGPQFVARPRFIPYGRLAGQVFDFQIVKPNDEAWYPCVKLGIFEVFPTGKYQKLNSNNFGTDATGTGSYRTQVNLVFQKLRRIYDRHYLRGRFSLIYAYFHPTHVKGFNTFLAERLTPKALSVPDTIFQVSLG